MNADPLDKPLADKIFVALTKRAEIICFGSLDKIFPLLDGSETSYRYHFIGKTKRGASLTNVEVLEER